MKRIALVLVCVLLAGGVVFADSDTTKAGAIKLKCGIMVSKDYSQAKAAKYFAEEIAKETDGRVVIDVFSEGVLGSDPVMWEAINAGALDMAVVSPAYIGNFVPEYQLYDLPFLFKSRAHRDAVVDGPIGAQLDKLLEKKGNMVVLGQFGGTGRIMISRNKKIETIDDLKGLKMRVYASPVVVSTWKALGTLPVTVAYAEAYTALQTGVIDAAENETSTLITQRWYEPCKYISMTEHNINTRPFLIGAKQFAKLPPDIQAIFRKVGKDAAQYAVKVEREDDARYIEQLKSFGLQILELKDKDKWIAATRDLRMNFVKKYNLEQTLKDIETTAQ